ncbi:MULTISPECIES: hypothetical protein [Parafrankia]|uniref:hypothetical protein n=1 Tax=Parafrankia TaxID=2994362 RepID=UPI001F60C573|nr:MULTISPECIES: hypothetical protein [Parafrankia]
MITIARTRSAAPPDESPPLLRLAPHPFQRAGAWAVTILAGREDPAEITTDDLAAVADQITADVVRAALAAKDAAAYDWWKVLFALFPNSEPTHAKRSRDRGVLAPAVARFFHPDADAPVRPCCFCGAAAGTLWSKMMLPLFDSPKALNTLPPETAGWPVCRPCRISLWAMPYGAGVTAGSATVLSCPESTVERAFVAAGCRRTARIRAAGFSSLPSDASPEAVTLWALRDHAQYDRPSSVTLWTFKNDNQDPWLRVSETRVAVVGFLRALPTDPAAYRGWRSLQRACHQKDKKGVVVRHGRDVVARALFETADRPPDQLCRELVRQLGDLEEVSAQNLRDWRALHALYLREMYGMDRNLLAPATTLLADWISAERNPRGRFNEYRKVAGRGFGLQVLMMEASARLYLDGRNPPDVTRVTKGLLAAGGEGTRLRGQLFFEVVAELVARGVEIGAKKAGGENPESFENSDNENENEAGGDAPLIGVDVELDGTDQNEEEYV